eukprot:TRINITY_DN7978_c0_g1_i1.p1 TRINITY_DN7978_c0_g1~~TRINITY_DN7978_c0_g1_i1.p1  ORF type:complete len:116 (+),score=21.24 TRINITY_DN7978_c0_g1_i1:489-836(+)
MITGMEQLLYGCCVVRPEMLGDPPSFFQNKEIPGAEGIVRTRKGPSTTTGSPNVSLKTSHTEEDMSDSDENTGFENSLSWGSKPEAKKHTQKTGFVGPSKIGSVQFSSGRCKNKA